MSNSQKENIRSILDSLWGYGEACEDKDSGLRGGARKFAVDGALDKILEMIEGQASKPGATETMWGEAQSRVKQLCRELLSMANRPSMRVPDKENGAYLRALHMVMDAFELDDDFVIGGAEDSQVFTITIKSNPSAKKTRLCLSQSSKADIVGLSSALLDNLKEIDSANRESLVTIASELLDSLRSIDVVDHVSGEPLMRPNVSIGDEIETPVYLESVTKLGLMEILTYEDIDRWAGVGVEMWYACPGHRGLGIIHRSLEIDSVDSDFIEGSGIAMFSVSKRWGEAEFFTTGERLRFFVRESSADEGLIPFKIAGGLKYGGNKWAVRDARGLEWHPSGSAQSIIQSSSNPGERVVKLCTDAPFLGIWHATSGEGE